MTTPTDQHKAALRDDMRSRLAAMSEQDRHAASAAACTKLAGLDVFRRASVVMLYLPLAHELDLTPLAITCFREGKNVCVPRVNWARKDMRPVEVTSFDDNVMQTDEHGVRSPKDGRPIVPSTIDMVVVPGLAFDVAGHRLGRGGGFYDRFLARLHSSATTVGLAFDAQVVDAVPTETGDEPVDILVTDRRVSWAGAAPRQA